MSIEQKLISIQTELKAPKNQFNSFGKYKYRSCEDILEAVKPLLKKHDVTLYLSDEIKEVAGFIYCEATAVFASEEGGITVNAQAGIEPNKKGMDISQSFGSSSSYARKYALNGLFLIDDTKDNDTEELKNETDQKATLEIEKQLQKISSVDELTTLFQSLNQSQQKQFKNLFSQRKSQL